MKTFFSYFMALLLFVLAIGFFVNGYFNPMAQHWVLHLLISGYCFLTSSTLFYLAQAEEWKERYREFSKRMQPIRH